MKNLSYEESNHKTWAGLIPRVQRVKVGLDSLGKIDPVEQRKEYRELLQDLVTQAENLAVSLRRAVFANGDIGREDYLCQAAWYLGIKITQEPGLVTVELPAQVPDRSYKNSSFLTEPLMAALRRHSRKQDLPRFPEANVLFVHLSPHPVYAHDEIESKQILDVLSTFLLRDDNPLYCDVCHLYSGAERPQTKVYILSRRDFPVLLREHMGGAAD